MHQYRNIPTRHPRQGFSLIELMIVIAIIAVLSAVAVPRYQDYVTRARWSVNLSQLEPLKLAIAECLQQEGGLPGACDTATKLGLADLPTPQHAASAASLASSGMPVWLRALVELSPLRHFVPIVYGVLLKGADARTGQHVRRQRTT